MNGKPSEYLSFVDAWHSRTEGHSQVLEVSEAAHGAGDFAGEVVAGEVKRPKLCEPANLCWDSAIDVVVLQ